MSFDNTLNILLQSLSNIFSKVTSSNNYAIFSSVTKELVELEDNIEQAKLASTLSFATCGDLDLHGKTYGISRDYQEGDYYYRQRLLNSYNRNNITLNNLKELIKDYSLGDIETYQYYYDRWWLEGKILPDPVTENVNTITGTIAKSSSGILISTIPDCWLVWDTTKTGTNYCSGCSFVNIGASGALISLTTPVSAGTPLVLTYTPNQITSGDYNYDMVPHSFLNNDTISKHRLLSNNFILVESNVDSIKIRTNMFSGYKTYISYFDGDVGTTYNWETTIDDDQILIINERTRVDNLIRDEYSLPTNLTQVITSYEIGNIGSVKIVNDSTEKNYAENNNYLGNTITLDTPLPNRTGVISTYNKYHIKDYRNLNFSQFTKTGEDDLRFTIQFNIWQNFIKYDTFKYGESRWGDLQNPQAVIVGELVDIAKAVGIKSDLLILINEVRYGGRFSLYGEIYYGGSIV